MSKIKNLIWNQIEDGKEDKELTFNERNESLCEMRRDDSKNFIASVKHNRKAKSLRGKMYAGA
jgi:hypothetical protein